MIEDELDIDSVVDVRDNNYVWCEGKIHLIIEQMNKETLYVVHFTGKPSSEDEVIYRSSNRLAKHGTYTKRKEIPRWESRKDKDGRNTHVLKNQITTVYPLILEQRQQDSASGETGTQDADEAMLSEKEGAELGDSELQGMRARSGDLGEGESGMDDQMSYQIN